ncbi:protein FANTASTIC FOUR 1-like [Chenopodium quinoa]|uniref:protein FANTASTIC FOUR 1-like n=1 Tax=Chenopodium quinoa TaxID=63459 RepID=UPI000B7754FB|nr:protein FANTASTIC FOUR 1-like [Chenopodium quinoa]
MTSICRNNSVNSFFGLPPPSLEEDHFSQAFHQTLGGCSSLLPPSQTPCNFTLAVDNHNNPLKPIEAIAGSPAVSAAGDKGNSAHIDLMSCTESIGFESSDEMISSFDDLGRNCCRNYDGESSSSSSSEGHFSRRRERGVGKRWEERKFPPPLTSLSENGRRNFVLKSVRNEGRLEIIGVMIEHPEILCATRDNGRLRMHLVKSAGVSDDEEDDGDDTEEVENEEEETAELSDDEAEAETAAAAEEEREWRRVPATAAAGGIRRCYQQRVMHHVWGPQQHRCVTTI